MTKLLYPSLIMWRKANCKEGGEENARTHTTEGNTSRDNLKLAATENMK